MDPIMGTIILFAGNFEPKGWYYCDGRLLSIAQNSALFSTSAPPTAATGS